MKIRSMLVMVIIVTMVSDYITSVSSLSPYAVLGISRTATDSEIDAQYRKLRSRNRRSRTKKNMVRTAYDQIMMERKFQNNKKEEVNTLQSMKARSPANIDEEYVYGYKLSDEYDDGRYFQAHFNETKHILEKMETAEGNRKTASFILFIGGIFIKLIPCIIIFFICRNRGRGNANFNGAMGSAAAGYRRLGRALSQNRR